MSEARPSTIPSLEELSETARLNQASKARSAARASHSTARAESTRRDAETERDRRAAEQQNVDAQLRAYAATVADALAKKDYPPEVSIEPFRIRIKNQGLKAGKPKIETEESVDGWILTPPMDARYYHGSSAVAPYANHNMSRKGFALGIDGEIYTYTVKEPLKGSAAEPMVIKCNLGEEQIVHPNQITRQGDQYRYNDSLLHPSLDPDNMPSHLSQDDLHLIHGNGILEALGDLYARAEDS